MPVADRFQALAMILLSGCCVLSLLRRRPRWPDVLLAGALGLLATAWLLRSPAYEGPGLLALNSATGLSAADAGVPPSLFLSAGVLYGAWRDRRRRRSQAVDKAA